MSISNIQNSSNTSIPAVNSIKNTKEENKKLDSTTPSVSKDISVIYTPTDSQDKKDVSAKKSTYTVNMAEINKMKAEVDQKTQALRDMVERLITKQGYTVKDVLKAKEEGKEIKITNDPEIQAQAQSEISDDGFWGVKQTAGRIIDYAKQLSGGDPAKAKLMRDAIEEGFKSAEKAFGGELPEISKQTYDAVMKGLDEWEGKSQSSGSEVSA